MKTASNILICALETRQLFETVLEIVHICTLEPDRLLQIQTRNAIRRLMYVNSSRL